MSSIWTGIKYAINSTLGTEKFKPLDVLYKDSFKLSPDINTVQATFWNSETVPTQSGSAYNKTSKKFKCNVSGKIAIKMKYSASGLSSTSSFRVYILKNGIYESTTGITFSLPIGISEKEEIYAMDVSEGDIIHMILSGTDVSYTTLVFSAYITGAYISQPYEYDTLISEVSET